MDGKPHQIREDGSGDELIPILEEKLYDEAWLQEVLRRQPSILPAGAIAGHFTPLISIGREIPTTAGFIDNLFVSPSGFLTIVETKLWRNPQARREVVAQAIDYTAALMRWKYADLDRAAREYAKKYEKSDLNLYGLVERAGQIVEGGGEAFEESVTRSLRSGRFLVLVVGDRIRETTMDIATYLNQHPGIGLEFALVELAPFRVTPQSTWPLVLFPRVVKRTEIVERSVVEVVVSGASATDVKVTQVRAERTPSGRRNALDESEFWALLQKENAAAFGPAKVLIDEYRENPEIVIDPKESSVVVKLDVRDTGQLGSLFFVSKDGRIGVWPVTLGSQLERAGFSKALAEAYGEQVRQMFEMPQRRKDYSRSILQLDLKGFREAVDRLIAELHEARPVE